MTQTVLKILAFMVLISCQNNNKTDDSFKYSDTTIVEQLTTDDRIEFEPYDYDTILNGDYNLKYKVYTDNETNEKLQSLTLRKGDIEIKVLSETSFPMLFKNLGYVGADFDSSFVFVQSFGSGNPHEIQLIDKRTGNELRRGTWVDVDEKEQVMLYLENEHEQNQKLLIYDVKNGKEIISRGFEKSKCVEQVIGGLRNCVEIDTVTAKEIILKIDTDKERVIKKYNR